MSTMNQILSSDRFKSIIAKGRPPSLKLWRAGRSTVFQALSQGTAGTTVENSGFDSNCGSLPFDSLSFTQSPELVEGRYGHKSSHRRDPAVSCVKAFIRVHSTRV
jgi:hypothetical protein